MRKIKIDPNTPIEAISLSKKTYNLLHAHGYQTVKDVMDASHGELAAIQGLNNTRLSELYEHLDDLRYGPLRKDPIPSVMDYVESWKNDCERETMLCKLNGVSLKSIAATIGIPESRIREKIRKVLIYRPALYEDRYIDIYRKYNFTCEDFCKLFGTEPYVYHYLSMINSKQRGTEPAQNAKSDPDVQHLISEK